MTKFDDDMLDGIIEKDLKNLRILLKAATDAVAIQGNRITQATIYMQKLINDYPVIMGKEFSHVINILEGTKP